MSREAMDDVIRIRIDATEAVRAFLELLAQQRAEGETRAPANPAATALWRELAPFRLVEYDYVDDGIGTILGAYVGFGDGRLYAASDDIPDRAVTELVKGNEHRVADLPPLYVYVVLEQPVGCAAIDSFLAELSAHVGHELDGIAPGGEIATREADRQLSKADLLGRFAAGGQRGDGRAYAVLTYAYARQVLEFSSAAARDDFVAWSRRLCDWIFGHGDDAARLGFAEAHRPAEPAPVPDEGRPVAHLAAPSAYADGAAWACLAPEAAPDQVEDARDYWTYVRRTIDAGRAGSDALV